jgi:transcription antitermination protein NusB
MISRRYIRVKVMQTLYSFTTLEKQDLFNKNALLAALDDKLNQVLDMFAVSVMYPFYVAQYAETDASRRSSKYLRTEDDMNVSIKVSTNPYMLKALANASLAEKIKKDKLERYIDNAWVKKIYQKLVATPEYDSYVNSATNSSSNDKAIIQFIWQQLILGNEDLMSTFNDDLPGWEDNCELISMLMDNYYKNNGKIDFSKLLSDEKRVYGHDLLVTVIEKEAYSLELLQPRLTNWDKERVAIIDMLLLRMAVCEFLYFPTIPTKVTINEYIDISKQYSLPQSGQFVNGVLDSLLKDLEKENKIKKEDRVGKKK